MRETDRFKTVDAEGRSWSVVEETTFEVRVGFVAKAHAPVEVGRTYRLNDGVALIPRGSGEFQTQDGKLRLTRTQDEFEGESSAAGPRSGWNQN